MVRSGEAGVREAGRAVGVTGAAVSKWVQSQGIVVNAERTPHAAIAANRERHEARRAIEAVESIAVAEVARGKVLQYLNDDRPSDARQASIVYGVMLDKHLLLTGQATSRTERTASPAEVQSRLLELVAAWEQRRAGTLPPVAAEDTDR